MLHRLKIHSAYFAAVVDGTKTFEIRNNNDRDFQKGDVVVLNEYDPDLWDSDREAYGRYLGRHVTTDITHVTNYEQKPGFVVFGIKLRYEESKLGEQE